MSVRGGADQADTTKPEISTDLQTSGPYNGEEMPITKLATGAAGVSTLVSAANGFPVTLDAASLAALESITAVISGAVALDAPTLAALETIGLDAATLAALESITIGTALPAGNNNIGDVDVLSLPSLPAGSAAIGKLAANSGVDIGDVDVTSLPALPAGTNNIGDVDVLTVPADPFGANADAVVAAGAVGSISAKLRRISQTLADILALIPAALGAGGGIKVDGSGTALPVSGTVTANAGTGTRATAGDIAHDAVDSGAPVKIGGVANNNAPSLVSSGDRVQAWHGLNGQYIIGGLQSILADGQNNAAMLMFPDGGGNGRQLGSSVFNGVTWDRLRTASVFKPISALAINAEATLWDPAAGKRFRLMGYVITQTGATGDITIKDGNSGATILTIPAHTLGVAQVSPDMGNGILGTVDANLRAIGVTSEVISGFVFGTEE